jgi:ABC-type transporter Mla maintaining outer membrane lipid asymmetry ATPase subunit MlaF
VTAVLHLSGVQKHYQSLRPLRLQALTIDPAERVAIGGLDASAAEVLVNLVTGRSLPDQGEVAVLGRPTSAIADGDDWLASLDRFGIVSDRGVLLDGLSVGQNLAMPFTLDIEPVAAETAERAAALAGACGIGGDWLQRPTAAAPPGIRARIHLARAVALEPALLILEHPTAGLDASTRAAFADDVSRVAEARQLAALIITQDDDFARKAAHRVLRLEPATGALRPVKRGWFR